jgi:hypothetical protein
VQTVIIAMLVGSSLGVGRGRADARPVPTGVAQAPVRARETVPVSLVASAVPCSSRPMSP